MKLIVSSLRTVMLSLVFLVILLGVTETLARTPTLQSYFLPYAIGKHEHMGPKLQQLEAIARREGTIDCIFMGDSAVQGGIDPEIFSAAYQQVTGESITCFNFALYGLRVTDIATIAEILAEDYHPRWILYGSGPHSYVDRVDYLSLHDDPWLQYRTGHFSLEGWLTAQSYAYRIFLTHRSWMNPDYPSKRARLEYFRENVTPYGFLRSDHIGDVSEIPDPEQDVPSQWYQMLTGYQIDENYIADLQRLIELQGTQIILFEMPVPPTYYAFLDHGQDDYQIFLDRVGETATSTGTVFIPTVSTGWEVPTTGWADYKHPNMYGAAAISQQLGQQVGKRVLQGIIMAQES